MKAIKKKVMKSKKNKFISKNRKPTKYKVRGNSDSKKKSDIEKNKK